MKYITECFKKRMSKIQNVQVKFRIAPLFATMFLISACVTPSDATQWAAQGFLTPGPTGEPELIGLYESENECRDAGEAWMSQQVVGNPVFANCLPVDHN
ncbi:hypothetical protein [Hyphococcus lacteus]|uniref:Uncharacterized protein n=1 Tax=Hyphococcus lacteus TaxID=3143536 RepID=A0ABV3Z618_9PROT